MVLTKVDLQMTLPGRKGEVVLTVREMETLRYVLLGKTVPAIASILSISPRTVENYMVSLKKKFACRSKVELVEYALSQDFYGILRLFDP